MARRPMTVILAALASAWLAVPSTAAVHASASNVPSVPSVPLAPVMMTQGMMFSGIEVPDMDKAKAFYIDTLGLKIALQIGRPGDPVHELALTFSGNPASGETMFFLVHHTNWTSKQNHTIGAKVAFRVRDLADMIERVRKAGYKVLSNPRAAPGGQGITVASVQDPNGLLVELLQVGGPR